MTDSHQALPNQNHKPADPSSSNTKKYNKKQKERRSRPSRIAQAQRQKSSTNKLAIEAPQVNSAVVMGDGLITPNAVIGGASTLLMKENQQMLLSMGASNVISGCT